MTDKNIFDTTDLNLVVEKSFTDFKLRVFHNPQKNELLIERTGACYCNPVVEMSFCPKLGTEGKNFWVGQRAHELNNKGTDKWMCGDFEIESPKGDLREDGLRAMEDYMQVRADYMKTSPKREIAEQSI